MVIKKIKIDEKFETRKIIEELIENDFESKKLVEKKIIKSRLKCTYLYIYEEYHLRTNSDLTVTIIVEEEPKSTEIELISTGGGVGLMSNSFGSEAASLKELYKLFKGKGFKDIN